MRGGGSEGPPEFGNRPKMLEFKHSDHRNGDLSGPDHRLRQPEGWRRQDHHGSQPGYLPGPRRRLRSRNRSRPPGQCHKRLWAGSQRDRAFRLRGDNRGRPGHGPGRLHERREPFDRAFVDLPRRSRSRAGAAPSARAPSRPHPHRARLHLRLHRAGLPALARVANRQRPDRRGRRGDPDPVRVLRARGAFAADSDYQSRAESPQPGPRDQGRRADDVRPADEPVCRSRRRGPQVPRADGLRHDHPTQRPPLGGAELRPPDRALPTRLQGRRGICRPRGGDAGARWAAHPSGTCPARR